MALCGNYRCGCGISAGSGITITGSGQDGDPWVVSLTQAAPTVPPPPSLLDRTTVTDWLGPFSTTVQDVAGLNVTFTGIAGRQYEITAVVNVKVASTSYYYANADVYLTNASNVVLQTKQVQLVSDLSKLYYNSSSPDVTEVQATLSAIVTPGAGSATYKIRARSKRSQAPIYVGGSPTQPATIQAKIV